jgi:hypothetical protein
MGAGSDRPCSPGTFPSGAKTVEEYQLGVLTASERSKEGRSKFRA